MLKTIKYFFISILSTALIFFFVLSSGIKVDSFSFGNFSVSKLYLKLDKKLILKIDEIVVSSKKSKVKSSEDDIKKNLEKLPKIIKIFDTIDVKRLKIKDNEFTVFLDNEHLYLDNKYVNISADMNFTASKISLDVYSIYLKDMGLTLMGKVNIDISKNIMTFLGMYNYRDIDGELNFQVKDEILDFYIDTKNSIKSLKFLKEYFRLDKIAEEWMYDNVQGDISLDYLNGKIDLNKNKPIMDSIKGHATLKNAKIRFNKKAQTVDTKEISINFENNRLSFDLEKPVYNGNKLYGSRVYIDNLISLKNGKVVIDLKSDSILNSDILEILKAFNINLPIYQKSGLLNSSLKIQIPYLASKKMKFDGSFKLKDALLDLQGFEFSTKKAEVVLKDSEVFIKNADIKHKDMLVADINMSIDTKKLTAKSKVNIDSFNIKSNRTDIVNIENYNLNLDLDFNKDVKINLEELNASLSVDKEFISVNIKDLSKIYPYSKILEDTNIKEGSLNLKIKDENNISFSTKIFNLEFPLEKEGEKITSLEANGSLKDGELNIVSKDGSIEIAVEKDKKPLIKLNNIDLNLSADLNKEKSTKLPNIEIKLLNSLIIFDTEHRYKAEYANIDLQDSKINFNGKALNLDLPISKDGKKITSLDLIGSYENRVLDIKTEDDELNLKYEIVPDKIFMKLNNYDVLYNTNQENNKDNTTSYYIDGTNSNIVINDRYKAKATSYSFIFENYRTDIKLEYYNTKFTYYKDFEGNINIVANNMNDIFLNSLIDKNLIKGGLTNLSASGKNNQIKGTAILNDTKIVDLAILNNLLIFINTSPGLINPLLAIPSVVGMVTNKGFGLNGYEVIEGNVDFSYDMSSKVLDMYKLNTKGNGIDFEGNAMINFDNSEINSKLKLIFFKNYSKIVGAIPVINYILLGDEKRVDTEVIISGTLENPDYKTKFVEEGVKAPLNLIKRILISPLKLIESLGKDNNSSNTNE